MKNDRTIRVVLPEEQKRWDAIISHPLQSWAWGDFRAAMGIDVVRMGEFEHNTLVNGWQLTFHKIPNLTYTIGYFPKGPPPSEKMLRELIKLGKQKHAISIQIEPDMPAEDSFDSSCQKLLRPAHRPLFTKYTFVLDLTKTEEELLASFHSKTRYNIRVAQKHGVIVSEDSTDRAFASYLALSHETTKRQKFYAHNNSYHKTMWKILKEAGIAHLFTATYQKQVLSTWIVFVWKDTVYYPYGASSREHREVMAPNLMLWEIVRWAKKRNLFYFDLWGALGPNPDEKDPWYGFHRFKEGYRPNAVEFIGSYDLIINPLLYKLYTLADSIRWFFLKHKPW
jgi:lipid II:glycine glycyltransferase (peptidoglycan interpeptide bridge formation enzyme)